MTPPPARERREQARRSAHFAAGVNSALAVIAAHDQEVVWREVVASCGGYDYLRGVSKRAGCLRIDGFTQYRKENR